MKKNEKKSILDNCVYLMYIFHIHIQQLVFHFGLFEVLDSMN
jgi:hypothetical protein